MWTPDSSIIITAEQKQSEQLASVENTFRAAIQTHIDDVAKARRYDSGNSLASYVMSTNIIWQAEAELFVEWRDLVWEYAYSELEKAMTGVRPIPTVEEFLNELPKIQW